MSPVYPFEGDEPLMRSDLTAGQLYEIDVSSVFAMNSETGCEITGYRIDRVEANGDETQAYDSVVSIYPFGKLVVATTNETISVESLRVFVRATNTQAGLESNAVGLLEVSITRLVAEQELIESNALNETSVAENATTEGNITSVANEANSTSAVEEQATDESAGNTIVSSSGERVILPDWLAQMILKPEDIVDETDETEEEEEELPPDPEISISGIDTQGNVAISFNTAMIVPPADTPINYSAYFQLIITSSSDLSQVIGTYQSPGTNVTNVERNLLAVTRGCVDTCDSEAKTFSWFVSDFTFMGMKIEIDLDRPEKVSPMESDYLQLEIIDTSLFWAESGLMLQESGVKTSNC